jgi:putative membrane protein
VWDRWAVEPVPLALLTVAAMTYVRGHHGIRARSRVLAAKDPSVPWAFWAGLGVVALAVLSPIAGYAEDRFAVHMVQHLLLVLVAAPLLVGSRALPALLKGSGAEELPDVRVPAFPLVAWVAFAATAWAVHLTPLFDLAVRDPAVHGFEHLLFLGSGLLFWTPALGRRRMPHPLRLLYLALAMPQNTFLALALLSPSRPLYEAYSLDDQKLGAGIMWVAGDLTLLVAVLAVAATWPSREEGEEEA